VPEFPDVGAFVEVFNRHGVDYVVIGGAEVQFILPDLVTYDVDFVPAVDPENLERLSAALTELDARIRTAAVPAGLPFTHDWPSLGRVSMRNLQCAHGAFDATFEPSGGGYDHLVPNARVVTVRGVDMPVADLADVVASKRLANRDLLRVGLRHRPFSRSAQWLLSERSLSQTSAHWTVGLGGSAEGHQVRDSSACSPGLGVSTHVCDQDRSSTRVGHVLAVDLASDGRDRPQGDRVDPRWRT
jgi:hypothetical protein